MKLHRDEITVDESLVVSLLERQRPEWARLPLAPAGAGTDNVMYRLGDELVVRLPRTAAVNDALRKERYWLPRLAPLLPHAVPEPVHSGAPTRAYPLAWSVYRWIDGEEPGPGTVRDWEAFGADLAEFVRELHGTALMGATPLDGLSWYRGGPLGACGSWVGEAFDACRALAHAATDAEAVRAGDADEGATLDLDALDLDALERLWRRALRLPGPSGPPGWLHGDLRPSNLLVREGALHAVIDFGALSIGFPDAEHAPLWDLPRAARESYRTALGVDEAAWERARAWAIAVGVSGYSHYRDSWPAFAAACRARLAAVLTDTAG
ncbi:aminoglycoside phosphotransferase family protein [Streptomyces sp. NPDC047999]|uniref:aminoglycoside phosphotransferase family protein n=1 Tax=Streptomyces sp. NPDC047999 TaxID=3365497 RepID=UPI003716A81F